MSVSLLLMIVTMQCLVTITIRGIIFADWCMCNVRHTIQMANGQFVVSRGVPGRTRTCTQYFDLLSVSIHWRNCNWSTEKHSVCLITLLLFLCCNRYTSHCVSTIIIPSRITDRSATILLLSYYFEGKNCTCNQNIASGILSWDITDPKTNDNNLTIYLRMPIHWKSQRLVDLSSYLWR